MSTPAIFVLFICVTLGFLIAGTRILIRLVRVSADLRPLILLPTATGLLAAAQAMQLYSIVHGHVPNSPELLSELIACGTAAAIYFSLSKLEPNFRTLLLQKILAQETNDRTLRVLEALPDAVLVTDSGGRILLSNSAARAANGGMDPCGRLADEHRVLKTILGSEGEVWRKSESAFKFQSSPEPGTHFDGTAVKIPDQTGKTEGFVFALHDVTERVRDAKRIQEYEERIHSLLVLTKSAPWELDLKSSRFTYVGKEIEQLLKYPAESWVDMDTWASRIHPDDRMEAISFCTEATRQGLDHVFSYRCSDAKGNIVWIQDYVCILFGEEGPEKLVGFMFDVTDRLTTESEIKVFKSIADRAGYGVATAEVGGKLLYVNEAFAKMHGYEPYELVGRSLQVLHTDSQMEDVRRINDVLLKEGKYNACEIWHKTKEGDVFPTLMSGTLIRDEKKNIDVMTATAIDISEWKRAEMERARLATAIEQAAETIVITDTRGIIQYANPAFESITGYTVEEALGQSPSLLKSGSHDEAFYRSLWERLSQGETWKGRFINKRKDGELFEEEATISPVRNGQGEIVNYVAVKKDVTEESRLQAQLRQSQKMEAIGTLAGGIAHDFNNIITPILGYAGMAHQETPEGSPIRGDLERIISAGERAAELVKQILTFSRQTEIEKHPIQAQLVVKEVLKLIESAFPTTIEIRSDIKNDCPAIVADPTQIHQIVMNLCTNAYQAMKPGGGVMKVELGPIDPESELFSTHPRLRGDTFVCLAVEDTGQGIHESILDRVFDPFFTTKKQEGTGLGLSVVHGIVTDLGGEIAVRSEIGKGTRFEILLPAVLAPVSLAASDRPAEPGGNEKVIFVDDDPAIAMMAETLLARLGYNVTVRRSALEVVEMIEKGTLEADIIVTDYIMPKMTGDVLIRKLADHGYEIPILLLTGAADLPNLPPHCRILRKPVAGASLSSAIRKTLDGYEQVPPEVCKDACFTGEALELFRVLER
jgi:PAS domain S-box-containing protein